MRQVVITLFLIFLLTGMTTFLQAQPPAPDSGVDPHGLHHKPRWGKMSANMENLRLLKLMEAVDLGEEQSEKFMPVFHGFRKEIRSLRQERDTLVNGIKEMIINNASDMQIKSELAKLKKNRAEIDKRHEKFFSDCEAVLTTPQLARLMIFQERFEKDMLESLREFRRHQGQHPKNGKPGKI